MLEVIALSPADVVAAASGGAVRVELVGTMDKDGLSPSLQLLDQVQSASSLPLRVMLRLEGGFTTERVSELASLAEAYEERGVAGVVLGFLDDAARVDLAVTEAVIANYSGEVTFHRALDHASDYLGAISAVASLRPRLTSILTAGSTAGVGAGMENLRAIAKQYADLVLVGGGLQERYVPQLRDLGFTKFHVGSAVRTAASFANGVDANLVAKWKELTGN